MRTECIFDTCVIGSSPLLLLYAIHEAERGKLVCMVEQNLDIGGAWATERLPGLGETRHVEISCHLVEWYNGGYELLESLSGAKFVRMNPQPVKIHPDGTVTPYMSTSNIYGNLVLYAGTVGLNFGRIFVRWFIGNHEGKRRAKLRLTEAAHTLFFNLRFRTSAVLNYSGIRAPLGGYAKWMQTLTTRLNASATIVRHDRAEQASRTKVDGWRVELASGDWLNAKKLVIGESTSMKNLDGDALHEPRQTRYNNLIVSIDAEDTLLRNGYIHCPNDTFLNRLTYLFDAPDDSTGVRSFWLVQSRKLDISKAQLTEAIFQVAKRYPFIRTQAKAFVIEARYERSFLQSPVDVPDLPPMKGDLVVLRSVGNLSRTALQNRKIFAKFLNS